MYFNIYYIIYSYFIIYIHIKLFPYLLSSRFLSLHAYHFYSLSYSDEDISTETTHLEKSMTRSCRVALLIKALAVKHAFLSSSPRTHVEN